MTRTFPLCNTCKVLYTAELLNMLYHPLWFYIACYIWCYKTIERCDIALLYNILWQVWWTSYIQAQQPSAYRQCSGGGGRVAGSAMHLSHVIRCQCCHSGRTTWWSATQQLTEPATSSGWFEVAALWSALHSGWDNLIWNCLAVPAPQLEANKVRHLYFPPATSEW